MNLFFWRNSALPTFSRGGIHPDEHKELTENLPIEDFIPASVSLPVSQSLGPSAEPVVASAAKVKRGDVIATVPGGVSDTNVQRCPRWTRALAMCPNWAGKFGWT